MNNDQTPNDPHVELINMIKAKEALVKQLKTLEAQLTEEMKIFPLGKMFQDGDGIVYQIIIPSGIFMPYKTIDYIRTRKEGEKAGTLSIKAAQEAGFSPSIPGGKE